MTLMMLDADVVTHRPLSVYRVLKKVGLLAGQTPNVTNQGTGFVQPPKTHLWHRRELASSFFSSCFVDSGRPPMGVSDAWLIACHSKTRTKAMSTEAATGAAT
jgi:hypothetical protein